MWKQKKKKQGGAEEHDLWETLRRLSLALTRGRKERNKPYPLCTVSLIFRKVVREVCF